MAHATRLLEADPALAAEQALEILKVLPNHTAASVLLATARRRAGDPKAAIEVLEPLMRTQAAGPAAWFEYGLALGSVGRGDEAIRALKKTVSLQPDHAEAWRALGDHLLAIGDDEGGDAAYARHIQSSAHDPDAAAGRRWRWSGTMFPRPRRCCARISSRRRPTWPRSACWPRSRRAAAATRTRRSCSRAASSSRRASRAARHNYALVLHRRNEPERALAEVERLLSANPRNPGYRNLHAVILSRIGEYERSGRIYAELLRRVSGAGQALAELRPRAEDRGPPGRQHRTPTGAASRSTRLRRGVLEPRQPQDLPLRRRRTSRRCGRSSRVPSSTPKTASTSISRSARRSRTQATTRVRSSTTRRAMRCTAPRIPTTPTTTRRASRALKRTFTREFFAERAGTRLRGARSDLHRRPAARRLDAARADPVQPFGGRRHDGAAGDHRDGARICAPRRTSRHRARTREVLAAHERR